MLRLQLINVSKGGSRCFIQGSDLTFCLWCCDIQEAQRLYPSVPFFGRLLEEDTTLGECLNLVQARFGFCPWNMLNLHSPIVPSNCFIQVWWTSKWSFVWGSPPSYFKLLLTWYAYIFLLDNIIIVSSFDIPYLSLTGEQWRVFDEYLRKKWPCCKGPDFIPVFNMNKWTFCPSGRSD